MLHLGLAWLLLATWCVEPAWLAQEPSEVEKRVFRLIEDLKGNDAVARRRAIDAIGDLGPAARAAEAEVFVALKDADRFVRRGAARAVGLIEADPRKAVPALTRLLRDQNREVAEAAADSLSKFGGPAVQPLISALGDKDPLVRRMAVQSLGRMGEAAKPAVPKLVSALESEPAMRRPGRGDNLRGVIVQALGDLGPVAKDAAPAIRETLEGNRDREYRRLADQALRKIESRR